MFGQISEFVGFIFIVLEIGLNFKNQFDQINRQLTNLHEDPNGSGDDSLSSTIDTGSSIIENSISGRRVEVLENGERRVLQLGFERYFEIHGDRVQLNLRFLTVMIGVSLVFIGMIIQLYAGFTSFSPS